MAPGSPDGEEIKPFLLKTYALVQEPGTDAIIAWAPSGDHFVVHNPEAFANQVLPANFTHNNFSSFIRQLNTYGFRKVETV
ncbi:HSF-type DNA-binding-domain-containing protein [Pavlovales sp. CCMP2436]|nr:HSF-type DNA-binding-domain-containing protein [Pavlovales sp. CCMP2436]|mmetsp:Transcript_38199/g.94699  ORF Transcript_38199/g.94699 Transcript_38199/m.94699 type:complete len:81 (-) Transcript_38199:1422-1664(-)